MCTDEHNIDSSIRRRRQHRLSKDIQLKRCFVKIKPVVIHPLHQFIEIPACVSHVRPHERLSMILGPLIYIRRHISEAHERLSDVANTMLEMAFLEERKVVRVVLWPIEHSEKILQDGDININDS
jgi:hypothetical protein